MGIRRPMLFGASLRLGAVIAACSWGAALATEPPMPPARPSALDATAAVAAARPKAGALPRGREKYFPLAEEEARKHGLPAEVADAVMRVESGYDPGVVGGVGERGLMQVLPSTAAMLGFSGTLDELAEPSTNVRLGVRYLAGAWRLAGGDLCRTLMKYRAGHGQERMSALSVEYCRRAKVHLTALGSPLGQGELPAVTLGPAAASPRVASAGAASTGLAVRGRRRVVVDGNAFWAAHKARVKAIESRLSWKRKALASR
ncbi:lytic transglycosylase domain-containing protein [Enterovirga rhinocerotis]|uniref:Transglycosylase-like protein with SLT domain n=1 Tax=Enterovirga rhinocerotis TaxID=1339210 RepID=A0A4R7CBC3_9HYPH|nr:transglycosylase SLT domain-containing protein [Enterovirga rhinocerotis]TDR94057.1 transglycosylase-like protein with SLT domain [Enterovirga rhinocerotis]